MPPRKTRFAGQIEPEKTQPEPQKQKAFRFPERPLKIEWWA